MAGAAWDGGGGKGEWAAGPGRQEEGDGERDRLGFFLPIEEEEIQSMIDKRAKYRVCWI